MRKTERTERFMAPLVLSRLKADIEKATILGRKTITISMAAAEALYADALARYEGSGGANSRGIIP